MIDSDYAHVIRCRDCLYWQDQEEGIVEMPICERHEPKHTGKIDGFIFPAGPKDYCSFAKRRSDD